MKILITGYKGFIGQNMVTALQDEHDLTLFDWGDSLPDLEGFNWCIHLGALTSTTETDVDSVLTQNYDFTRFLLKECDKHRVGVQFASSASVYGLNTNFKEDAPVDPRSPYAWSKYLCERYIDGFAFEWKTSIQVFRYFNVYGPHEEHKGNQASPFSKFEQQAKETGVIKLFEGSDNFKRDFIHVDKVVEVHKKMLSLTVNDNRVSGTFNLGTGHATSFEAVARSIAEKYGARVEYIPMPDNVKNQYQSYTCADMTKLNKLFKNADIR